MKIQFFSFLAFGLTTIFCTAQIKNIESMRMWTGDKKLVLDSGISLSYNNNNGDYVLQFDANAGALFKFKDKNGDLNNKLFLKGDYSLIRAEDQAVVVPRSRL